MRNVPELRFDGFDGEWEEYRFNDITKLSQGLQIPIDERYLQPSDDTYFYITNEFLKPGSKKHYYIKNPNKSVIANKDDILMTRTGNTGKVLTDVEGAFHNNFFKIAYDNSSISKYYLFYLLNSGVVQNKILRLAGSSTILDLNHKDFYSIASSFPSLKEQGKIGKIFKSLDSLIEIQEDKVSKMEDFKKSMLQKMLPKKGELVPDFRFDGFDGEWEEKIVGDLLDYEQPTKYIVSSEEYYETGIPVLTANKSFILGYTDEKNIYNKGEVVLFDDFTQDMKYVNFPFMVKSSALKILTEKNSNLFFMFNLLSNINLINEGHKRHYISVVQNTNVVIPSLEEQAKIGQFFKNLDTQIENEEKLLESYKMMKKSLLQKMFV